MSEELYCPNIRFGTFDLDISGRDGEIKLDGFTVMLVISDPVSEDIIKRYAKILLAAGCRDFAFCGVESDKWHKLFDEVDIERTENEEDYATTYFLMREKIIIEDYIEGLKFLSDIYEDRDLLTFVDDLKNSDMYKTAFAKSAELAKKRNVPANEILESKADIDSYFRGGN